MRMSPRSYAFLAMALLAATFGTGQIWSLALGLRAGAAGVGQMILGVSGLALLLLSGVVLVRFLYVLGPGSRATPVQKQIAYRRTHKEDGHDNG